MRIGIVNDLALARETLRRLIQTTPEHSVAWLAENGEEAVRRAIQDPPDVILMDLVMPVMDGVEATRRIMAQKPCSILLVTSSITGNFNLVYRAMGHGGLDAVNTPTLGPDGKVRDGEGLVARLEKLARARTFTGRRWPTSRPGKSGVRSQESGVEEDSGLQTSDSGRRIPLVVLGASTGGPEALSQILSGLPAAFPAAVVILQHIAADFAPSLAEWLQRRSALPVQLVKEGTAPAAGQVYLAGTDDHLVLRADGRFAHSSSPEDCPYRPSVDAFFESVVSRPRPGVAVLLTGMGSDGAVGLARLRQTGWWTIAQDQATSVVYGMPRAAAELNAACQVLPLPHITSAVLKHAALIGSTG
jgi:two-component system response regulator WspF